MWVEVGDVAAKTLQSEVAKAFDGWCGSSAALRKVPYPTLHAPPKSGLSCLMTNFRYNVGLTYGIDGGLDGDS